MNYVYIEICIEGLERQQLACFLLFVKLQECRHAHGADELAPAPKPERKAAESPQVQCCAVFCCPPSVQYCSNLGNLTSDA